MTAKVFISHRQEDRDFASIIQYHLCLWGIPRDNVYLSSDAKSGLRFGKPLSADLRIALKEANLFVLVYTYADENWSRCMWEAGAASDPNAADSTRIIVFRCGPDVPEAFGETTRVDLSEQSIQRFVSAVLREADFVPGQAALNPNVADADLSHFARRLHEELEEEAGTVKHEVSRWEYFQKVIQAHSIFGATEPSKSPYDLFVLMPFSPELKPIFDDHVKKVTGELGLHAGRADDFFSTGSIVHEIWAGICHADIIVADCTGRNPNVFYEIGIAHTLDKRTILISQSMDDVPFDLRHMRIIEYDFTPRGMHKFEDVLKNTIRAIRGCA